MNFLLSINKKYVLTISIVISLLFVIFFIFKFYNNIEGELSKEVVTISKVDITEPKFAINGKSNKIFVSAKEGNFVDEDKILLKKNVWFKSNNFSIESDNVTFDRKNQTAHSKENSVFKSQKTTISSEGFDIYDNGNKIKFYGNAIVILK